MPATRPSTSPRRLAGLAFVAACALGATACGDFQVAEFTRATTTTVEVEAANTTIVPSEEGGEGDGGEADTTLEDMRYTVEPGDSISGIAAEFGVLPGALMEANGLADPAELQAGQELVIPDPDAGVTPPWQQREEDEQQQQG